MKFALIAASMLLATSAATGAASQDAEAPEAATEVAATFTIDTPIAELMADEGAKAVVDANVPGLESHPAYDQFKGFSLPALKPFSDGLITDEMLAAVAAGLAELG